VKAILTSKRFNPGHVSHIEANAKLLKEQGFDVQFLVHDAFLSFPGSIFNNFRACASDYISLSPGDLFIVWFPSLSVLFDILLVRLLTSATVVYIYHEPYTSFVSYRKAGFSRIKALKVTIISIVSQLISSLSHKIIFPSIRAYNAVPVARSNKKRYAKINLLFPDEATVEQLKEHRNFISYIGTIAEDHAFEDFVRLIHFCIFNEKLTAYRFLIATRSIIPEKHSPIIEECISSGRLVVQSGTPMSNASTNDFYAQSYLVWNAYKRSMQSGVLPKAYMFGTPVIMSVSNQSEYFVDDFHGVLIPDQCSAKDFEHAILRVERNWKMVSNNCRQFFLSNFDYRALAAEFIEFISER